MQQQQQQQQHNTARRVAIISRKGGTGKTTTAFHLAHGLAHAGMRVLMLEIDDNPRLYHDLTGGDTDSLDDSQTTYSLFVDPELGIGRAAYQVRTRDLVGSIPSLHREHRERLIAARGWTNPQDIDFVPGSERLRTLENRVTFAESSSSMRHFDPLTQLARALDVVGGSYDVILMDTLPSLSVLQTNVLMAADEVIYVVDFDSASIKDFKRTDNFVRNSIAQAVALGRTPPHVMGVVYNKYDESIPENDVALLHSYTEAHFEREGSDRLVGPAIPYQNLGVIPFDKRSLVGAVNAHVSLHTWAPTTKIGEKMWLMTDGVRALLTAPVPA